MTEAAAAVSSSEASAFVQAWAVSLAQVLGQIAGTETPCHVLTQAPGELAPAGEGDLWALCVSSGGLRGELSLRLSPAATLRIAQIFMSEPATPEAVPSDIHREAVVEFFRQVAGLVASALKPRWGEVQLRIDPATGAASWPAASSSWLQAGDEGPGAILVELHLSAAILAALRAGRAESTPQAAEPAPVQAAIPSAAAPSSAVPSSEAADGKLDLLMDVELAMTLRFGGRRLSLREILELSPGSVVELDRQVHEPVDVLLDGRLVARGEVVVMDGNYGLRVTEVAPPPVI
ncbi:MAG TPA: flagellar motor switch protein FliN [Terriglobales bacterium]|nr:flagellar motor switch protein FliN [Terriglobales bacterium]